MISHPKDVFSSLNNELQKHGVAHQSNNDDDNNNDNNNDDDNDNDNDNDDDDKCCYQGVPWKTIKLELKYQ